MAVFNYSGGYVNPESPFIRVCAFNVGNFSGGESGDPAGTDEMYNKFLTTFRKCGANIYFFSEWDVNWDASTTSLSKFSFFKDYRSQYIRTGQGEYAGQMIYSDFPITNEYHMTYSYDSDYYFIDDTIKLCGKSIHLICTHLSWKTQQARQAQIRQLLNYISSNNISYYIIGGDMNLGLHRQDGQPETDEIKFRMARENVNTFLSGGAVSLQGSAWGRADLDGFFNTVGEGGIDGWRTNIFDNIVVSSNIRFANMFDVESTASDHNAICADLEILP